MASWARRIVVFLAVGVAPAHAYDCYTEINPLYLQTDVPALIDARSSDDVQRIRSALIAYIWKAPAPPQTLPVVTADVANPVASLTGLPAGTRVDELSVTLDEFVSRMYLYTPPRARRKLMIVHQGHNTLARADGTAPAAERYLRERYHVLVVHMPMYGPNSNPFGTSTFFHEPMFLYRETPTLSPFKYFLEPVVQAINYAVQVRRIRRISMIGLSGGGWTTTMAAAIDPRIKTSVAVAGSIPLFLLHPDDPCVNTRRGPDREQVHPELYGIADHLDLYILAAHGQGRGHLQVVNQYDRCCFEGLRWLTYRDHVRRAVRELRLGRYDIFLDSSHTNHMISPYALETAVLPFVRYRRF